MNSWILRGNIGTGKPTLIANASTVCSATAITAQLTGPSPKAETEWTPRGLFALAMGIQPWKQGFALIADTVLGSDLSARIEAATSQP